MNKTKVEWCDSTWKPVTGCRHGCEYCYAKQMAHRFSGYEPRYGASLTQDENGNYDLIKSEIKYRLDRKGKKLVAPYPFGFEPTFHRYKLDDPQKWKASRTIFVCSMADLFGEWVPDEWIDEVFAVCEKALQHRYMFLTKNPKRYVELARSGELPKNANMWYGSTTTTCRADFYLDKNRNTFLSVEPLLSDFPIENVISKGRIKWLIIGA